MKTVISILLFLTLTTVASASEIYFLSGTSESRALCERKFPMATMEGTKTVQPSPYVAPLEHQIPEPTSGGLLALALAALALKRK